MKKAKITFENGSSIECSAEISGLHSVGFQSEHPPLADFNCGIDYVPLTTASFLVQGKWDLEGINKLWADVIKNSAQ